jgi:peptidoglycan/xylan/chitin deacetylase (PgdA/CDA1 family)
MAAKIPDFGFVVYNSEWIGQSIYLYMRMRYLVKTPWWLKKVYSSYTWDIPSEKNELYLTFDDGPHPSITPFVLEQLASHNALASFFCIGKNVKEHPGVYQQIIQQGHSVGNHTYSHLNGWKVKSNIYFDDVKAAAREIQSSLFRPPYGRILRTQAKKIPELLERSDARIIMWDVLSGDFDTNLSKEQCLHNVISNAIKGSIIVFHDSEKAFPLLKYVLPRVLKFFEDKNFVFKNLK